MMLSAAVGLKSTCATGSATKIPVTLRNKRMPPSGGQRICIQHRVALHKRSEIHIYDQANVIAITLAPGCGAVNVVSNSTQWVALWSVLLSPAGGYVVYR
jgi:hypothetical protein